MKKNTKNFCVFSLAGFVLCSGASLQAMEQDEKEKEPAAQKAASVVMPTYEAFEDLHKVLACVGEEMDKVKVNAYKGWKTLYNAPDCETNQTESGILFAAQHGKYPDSLHTQWGSMPLACEYGSAEFSKLEAITKVLLDKRFKTTHYKTDDNLKKVIYAITEVNGEKLPEAKMRKKSIDSAILKKSWKNFSEVTNRAQKNLTSAFKAEQMREAHQRRLEKSKRKFEEPKLTDATASK